MLWWRSLWRRRNTKPVSRSVQRTLWSGLNSVNCKLTIIIIVITIVMMIVTTIVVIIVITIATSLILSMKIKGTSQLHISFSKQHCHQHYNITIGVWFKSIIQLSIFVLWWISLRSQKCHCKLCFDNSLKPSAFLETPEYGIKIWQARYGHQFSREVHLLQHSKHGNQNSHQCSLRTALSCEIFAVCLLCHPVMALKKLQYAFKMIFLQSSWHGKQKGPAWTVWL